VSIAGRRGTTRNAGLGRKSAGGGTGGLLMGMVTSMQGLEAAVFNEHSDRNINAKDYGGSICNYSRAENYPGIWRAVM
jgi:thioredoxin reductase